MAMETLSTFLVQDDFLKTVFDAIPCSVMIIDKDHRIQAVNHSFQKNFDRDPESAKKLLIGYAIKCENGSNNANACGFHENCTRCHLLAIASEALEGKKQIRKRITMSFKIGEKFESRNLLISASPLNYQHQRYTVLIFEDITEFNQLQRQIGLQKGFAGIIGQDVKMLELFDVIRELAEIDAPVLIQGESGTGKELVALAIHNLGSRKGYPFIAVNCGALPETLLESELFGHVKGAFTGAFRDKKGRFEIADHGTIFLDEIGEISPRMQVKLLRVLQEGTFERVGGEKTTKVNVRIISATNRDLQKEIANKNFREDLYYRLCVVPLQIPPLRERKGDIPLILDYILQKEALENERIPPTLSSSALEALLDYHWPGNIRELQNTMQYALVKSRRGQVIDVEHLPPNLTQNHLIKMTNNNRRRRKRKLDVGNLREAISKANGNKLKAAQILGVSRATLYRFIEDAGLTFD
jgi:transcriptional regulator with PAS, ATPase and Fis domain